MAMLFVLVLVLLCQQAVQGVWTWSALSVEVEPKSEKCFYEEMMASVLFEMDFEVIRGGLLDIELVITSPKGDVAFRNLAFFNSQSDKENEEEGLVKFTTSSAGVYKICFSNQMSRWTPKVVSFAVHSNVVKQNIEVAKLEHLGPVVDSVIKVSDQMEEIEKMQHHMRIKETVHMDVQANTNSRVFWLSFLESVVLLGVSGAQLYYVQTWFANSRNRRRV